MTSALYRNDRPATFPNSWYAATADLPRERSALRGQITADVCIIGAGYTGLSAALDLAQAGYEVVVLDAHRAGWGASGRNGGQVCTGFNQSQRWLEARLGRAEARALWDLSLAAVERLKSTVAAHAPDARFRPGIAHGAYSATEARKLRDEVEFLRRSYGYDAIHSLTHDAFQSLVKAPAYQGGLIDRGAGHIHPLRYALGLAQAAETAGARLYERSEVHHITQADPAIVATNQGRVTARFVLLAGNGYLPDLCRPVATRTLPVNSYMVATEPLGERAAQLLTEDIAVADDKHVVNYFRLSEDHRLLFGGRSTARLGFPHSIPALLRPRIESLFPDLKNVAIDYSWGGTLGLTRTRLPLFARPAQNIFSAGGFSGHGVALSGFAGHIMAQALRGQAEQFDLCTTLPTPPFPGGRMLRSPLLAMALSWYRLRDRFNL